MPHHNRGRRKGARQIDDVGELWVIEPSVEAEPERRQPLEPGTKIRPLIELRPGVGATVADDRAIVPASGMAHPAKAAATGPQMGQQDGLDRVAEGQIGIADDAGRDAGWAVIPRGAHRGDARDELGLADRAIFGQAAPRRVGGAVHRAAFEKDGRDDVVAGVEVGEQLVEEIAVIAALPQMMVGIDDRQIRVEHGLFGRGPEPCLVRGIDMPEFPVLPGLRHGPLSSYGALSGAEPKGVSRR
jgi:hypothetical protein